ncbi:MAG: Crp/Fnr family transcriptional regulator, partial [Rubrivivax sp.]
MRINWGVPERPVLERARDVTEQEWAGIPWLRVLSPEHQDAAVAGLRVATVQPGERIVRLGRPATFWFGVIDGLLKMSNDTPSGGTITYMGVPPGAWFGEGTLIKREPYRYNIEALRRSTVAGLPIDDFHALLDRSIPFNRYL